MKKIIFGDKDWQEIINRNFNEIKRQINRITGTNLLSTNSNTSNGTKWFTGTSITGENTEPTIFSSSGIGYSYEDDYYLNTATGAIYKCVNEGNADSAKWIYEATFNSDIVSQLNEKANISDVKIFSSLAEIGLSESDMTTDFSSNVLKIIRAMGANRKIVLYPYKTETNNNLYNSVNSWCGEISTDAFSLEITSSFNGNEAIKNKIEVFPNTVNGNNKYIFGFYDNQLGQSQVIATSKSPTKVTVTPLNGFAVIGGSTSVYFKSQENIVTINCFLQKAGGITGTVTLCNLPSGYRPKEYTRCIGILMTSNASIPSLCNIIIEPGGNVIANTTETINNIYFNISYLAEL